MRKLAIVSGSFSTAVFLAVYLLPFRFVLWTAGLLGVMGVLALLTKRLWLRPMALALLGAAVGFGCFYVHDLQTTVPVHLLDGSTRSLHARVLDYPDLYEHYHRVTVRIEEEGLPAVNALLFDNSMGLADVLPGDTIIFEAKLSAADQKYGEDYRAYSAKDIYLKLNASKGVELLRHESSLRTLPKRIQHALITRIESIFPADVVSFMKSLMLGDKSDLYQDERLYLALSRAGNMHALAVSGLHIAYLVGALQLMLGKGRFSSLLCMLLIWLFVPVTGGSPSAVRAAVMQTLLLAAPLLRRENDPPTSLFFALALILLQNPRAAASVSLQLSFGAMAGILCFGERVRDALLSTLPKEKRRTQLQKPVAAAASALAVLPFTVPLMAVHFGFVSLVSPISAVLCYLAISCCFIFGYLSCLASILYAPFGMLLAQATAWLARYLMFASRLVSAIPYAVVYTDFRWCLPWIIGVYALFLAYRFLPLRSGEKLLIPTLLAVLSLILLSNTERARYEQDAYFSVLDVGQGQCLCAMSGGSTVVIDCGNLMQPENAGDLAGRFLIAHGRESIDALILTHLDNDHVGGVPMLMAMLPVGRLILPADAPDEQENLTKLLTLAQKQNIPVHYLREDAVLQGGGLKAELFAPLSDRDSNDGGLFARLRFGRFDAIVTGDASAKLERSFLMHALPVGSELLVVGHHGSKHSSSEELLSLCGADTAVISVGFNSYGHPAEESLARLAANAYTVYRTDEDGTVTIHIEDGHGEEERERRSQTKLRS